MRIYLDYNATTPTAPEVAAAMRPFQEEQFGNAVSAHWAGITAREAVEAARAEVAALISATPDEIVFTSGGSESNNHVIKGLFFSPARRGSHIVTTTVEHGAILEPCRFLERLGASVTRVAVDRAGRVDPDDIARAVRDDTFLISVMHAQNEVGTLQPIAEIGTIARQRGVLFHSDAAQSLGKIPVDVGHVDLLSIAGHKLYAPKGVGALYARQGVRLEPLVHGSAHQRGRRAGTESVALTVGLGAACRLARTDPPGGRLRVLRDRLWDGLSSALGDRVALNGHLTERLPNTVNAGFRGRSGFDVLASVPEIAASTGAACHSGSMTMSAVLEAMGVDPAVGLGAVRFSIGRYTTAEEIDAAVDLLVNRESPGESAVGTRL